MSITFSPRTGIRFVWHPKSSHWEIREMFGIYAFRICGMISLERKIHASEQCWWRVYFLKTGESWFAELDEILLLFDMAELYLNDDEEYLNTLSSSIEGRRVEI